MQGVDYPVLGVSDTGDTQMMYPDQDYKFDGKKVTEYPMAQDGKWLDKYQPEPMRQDATRNVISRKMTDKEKLEAVATSDQAQKRALSNAKEVIAERQKGKKNKGDINKGEFTTQEKLRAFPNSVGGVGEMFDEYVNPAFITGELASNLGNAIASRDPRAIVAGLAVPALAGVMGLNPVEDAAAITKGIPKATRAGLNTIDRNFTPLGKSLAASEKWGIEQGMSPHEIKQMQLEKLGITSSQREAYVPGVSDFLSKYVVPFGYGGAKEGESKLMQTLNNIKTGKIKYDSRFRNEIAARNDSWNLYLGKPQTNNTFKIAETSPVNHPAYNPEQLNKMDIYSINRGDNTSSISPRDIYSTTDYDIVEAASIPADELSRSNGVKQRLDLLKNGIVTDRHMPVMGGYNKRLSPNGLDYNDVWDLEPTIKNPITKKPMKVKIDNFIGKPFMSHGVFPEITTETELNYLNGILNHSKEWADKANSRITFNKGKTTLTNTPIPNTDAFEIVDNIKKNKLVSKSVDKLKEEIKNIKPKQKNGGWLDKYK
jgi:hypothetical protein